MKMRILSAWKVLKAIEKIEVLYLIVMLHKQHALTIQMKITSTETRTSCFTLPKLWAGCTKRLRLANV